LIKLILIYQNIFKILIPNSPSAFRLILINQIKSTIILHLKSRCFSKSHGDRLQHNIPPHFILEVAASCSTNLGLAIIAVTTDLIQKFILQILRPLGHLVEFAGHQQGPHDFAHVGLVVEVAGDFVSVHVHKFFHVEVFLQLPDPGGTPLFCFGFE